MRPRRVRHDVLALEQELTEGAGVVPVGLKCFNVRLASGRKHLTIGSSAVAVLVREPSRGKESPAVAGIPEHSRTHDGPPITWEICPCIVIDVVRFLPVATTQERGTPAAGHGTRKKSDGIRRPACRAIQQELLFRLAAWTPRQEVDDAAHRAGTIEGRRHAFDNFDLPEIHRRNLQQAEPANLTKQWQAVGKHTRVPPAHPLNADTCGTERRRRRLHPHSAHFVQHHDDVPGRHEHLLLDLFAGQDFDPHRLILEPLVGPSRRYDRDGLLDRRLCLQLHHYVLCGAGCDLH